MATTTLPATVSLLLDDFVKWAQRDKSPQASAKTAKRYRRYAETICASLGHPVHISTADLQRWRSSVGEVSESTLNVWTAAARAFFGYLQEKGVRQDNPAAALNMLKVPDRLPRPFTHRQIKDLFDAVYAQDNLQDRAILEVLYGSGLRREECGNLLLSNLFERDRLRLVGKGDKERYTIVTELEYRALRDWVLTTPLVDDRTRTLIEEINADAAFDDLRKRKPQEAIFYGPDWTPLPLYDDPGNFVWKRCQIYFEQTQIEEATPHRFRHSFATHLLSNGVDVYAVSKMLGHSDIKITEVYLKLLDKTYDVARQAHPRAA